MDDLKHKGFEILDIPNQEVVFVRFDYPLGDTLYGPFKSLDKAQEFGETNAATADMLPQAVRKE